MLITFARRYQENARLWEWIEEADRQQENMLQHMADGRERVDVIHHAARTCIEALMATVADGQDRQAQKEDSPDAVERPESNDRSLHGVRGIWLRRLLSG